MEADASKEAAKKAAQKQARASLLYIIFVIGPVCLFCGVIPSLLIMIDGPDDPLYGEYLTLRTGIILFLALVVVLFLAASAILQATATASDRRKYLPPGALVDVGSHKLHLYCTGEGNPTVIMDAGSPSTALDWELVRPEVAKLARVCTYDRAGYGWSESGPKPRTSQQIAGELHTLLHQAGVEGPYVLVGQDFGGLNMRAFAVQYPSEVAGMVMVNSSHEDELPRLYPEVWPISRRRPSRLGNQVVRAIMLLGLWRYNRRLTGSLANLPPEVHAARRALMLIPQSVSTAYDEVACIEENIAGIRAAGPLPDVPMVVLVRGQYEQARDLPRNTPYDVLERIWKELQAELASRSSEGKLIVAENSTRYIHLQQPELVVEAIREVVEAARQKQSRQNAEN